MISSQIFVGLLFCLHECFASSRICDVIAATKFILLPTNSNFCDDYVLQSSSLCQDKYLESALYSCNSHGEIQSIDLSGFGIVGETIYCVVRVHERDNLNFIRQDDYLPQLPMSRQSPSYP